MGIRPRPTSQTPEVSTIRPGAFVFFADRSIARGEECTTSYGHVGEASNAVLMLDYGFCLPYSSHDEAHPPRRPSPHYHHQHLAPASSTPMSTINLPEPPHPFHQVNVDLSPPAAADPMQAVWLQRLGLADYAARTSLTLLDRRSGAPQTSLPTEVLITLRVRALGPSLLRSASPQQLMQPLQPRSRRVDSADLTGSPANSFTS